MRAYEDCYRDRECDEILVGASLLSYPEKNTSVRDALRLVPMGSAITHPLVTTDMNMVDIISLCRRGGHMASSATTRLDRTISPMLELGGAVLPDRSPRGVF
jgi:hypothetical protein